MRIKKIEGYDNYYITDSGKVLSTKGNDLKWLKIHEDNSGYTYVGIYKNATHKRIRIHRLVAEAFIPNPENKPCVDHINGIRDDNRVENLRWCTHQENMSFPLARKRNSEAHKGKKLSSTTIAKLKGRKSPMEGKHHSKESNLKNRNAHLGRKHPHTEEWNNKIRKAVSRTVAQIDLITKNVIAIYDTIHEAERQTGINNCSISLCCGGKRKSAGKYKWVYLD